jgi:hypothetical protein
LRGKSGRRRVQERIKSSESFSLKSKSVGETTTSAGMSEFDHSLLSTSDVIREEISKRKRDFIRQVMNEKETSFFDENVTFYQFLNRISQTLSSVTLFCFFVLHLESRLVVHDSTLFY